MLFKVVAWKNIIVPSSWKVLNDDFNWNGRTNIGKVLTELYLK